VRFSPYPRTRGTRPHTKRRQMHAQRAVDREAAKYPLFADQFVAETAEERMTRQDEGARIGLQYTRDCHALMWKRGRALLATLPEPQRSALRAEWNGYKWLPGSPEYLLDFLRTRGISERGADAAPLSSSERRLGRAPLVAQL